VSLLSRTSSSHIKYTAEDWHLKHETLLQLNLGFHKSLRTFFSNSCKASAGGTSMLKVFIPFLDVQPMSWKNSVQLLTIFLKRRGSLWVVGLGNNIPELQTTIFFYFHHIGPQPLKVLSILNLNKDKSQNTTEKGKFVREPYLNTNVSTLLNSVFQWWWWWWWWWWWFRAIKASVSVELKY
jgi:hypothetical protein